MTEEPCARCRLPAALDVVTGLCPPCWTVMCDLGTLESWRAARQHRHAPHALTEAELIPVDDFRFDRELNSWRAHGGETTWTPIR